MTHELDIRIQDILETAKCDMTGKETECLAVSLHGEPPSFIATTKFLEWIRFERKRFQRRNGEQDKSVPHAKPVAN